MSPDAMFSFHNGLILLLCGLLSLIVPFSWAQQRSNKPDEFNCPEEFGYYPHPTDCTQYYVCVFGGALLESCTGGLMYSHDLQTCDWPRNVGCAISASETSTSSSSINNANGINNSPGNEELQNRYTTSPWKYEPLQQQSQTLKDRQQQAQQQEEIPDRHLYEEENLGPAEEVENDRQQRVYRGQPPTLGQVARDRDGIIRHANALQTSAGPEKIKPVAMLSFNSLHNSLSKGITTEPLNFEQYIEESTDKFEGKFERRRLQRDLTNRTYSSIYNSSVADGEISRSSYGSYALRYRPLNTVFPNSTENFTSNQFIMQNTSTTFPKYIQSTPLVKVLFSTTTPNSVSSFVNPAFANSINSPSLSFPSNIRRGSSLNQNKLHFTNIKNDNSGNLPSNALINSNQFQSGSSHINSYTNVNDSPLVVTDFSIVNVIPKTHQSTHLQPQPQTFPTMYESHGSSFRPQIYPHPLSYNADSISNLHSHPHSYNGHHINSYYGSVGSPSYAPFPSPHFYPPLFPPRIPFYSPPETSIVTLTYPQLNAPIEQPSSNIHEETPSLASTATTATTTNTTTPVTTTTIMTEITSAKPEALEIAQDTKAHSTHINGESNNGNNNEKQKVIDKDAFKMNEDNEDRGEDEPIIEDIDEDTDDEKEEEKEKEDDGKEKEEDKEEEKGEVDEEDDRSHEDIGMNSYETFAIGFPSSNQNQTLSDVNMKRGNHENTGNEYLEDINDDDDVDDNQNYEGENESTIDEKNEQDKKKNKFGENDKSEIETLFDDDDESTNQSKETSEEIKEGFQKHGLTHRNRLKQRHRKQFPIKEVSRLHSPNINNFQQQTQPVKVPLSFSSFYRRYLTDENENPLSNPDSDPNTSPIDLTALVTNSHTTASNKTITRSKMTSRVKKSVYPSETTYHQSQIRDDSLREEAKTGLRRRNDHIVTLQIYDKLPNVLVKRTRATKPIVGMSNRVVPLALLHSYKPANYSYPNHQARYRLYQPNTNINTFINGESTTKPIMGYNWLGKTNQISSFPSYRYQSPTTPVPQKHSTYTLKNTSPNFFLSTQCGVSQQCNNEDKEHENNKEKDNGYNYDDNNNAYDEEDEDIVVKDGRTKDRVLENNNPNFKENEEEYYDDYAGDYVNDDHLKEPLTKPIVPKPPSRLTNIDYEITTPMINFDDHIHESEGENEELKNDDNDSGSDDVANEEYDDYVDNGGKHKELDSVVERGQNDDNEAQKEVQPEQENQGGENEDDEEVEEERDDIADQEDSPSEYEEIETNEKNVKTIYERPYKLRIPRTHTELKSHRNAGAEDKLTTPHGKNKSSRNLTNKNSNHLFSYKSEESQQTTPLSISPSAMLHLSSTSKTAEVISPHQSLHKLTEITHSRATTPAFHTTLPISALQKLKLSREKFKPHSNKSKVVIAQKVTDNPLEFSSASSLLPPSSPFIPFTIASKSESHLDINHPLHLKMYTTYEEKTKQKIAQMETNKTNSNRNGYSKDHRPQKFSAPHRPPPVSAPTYIIEQSPSAVPSTSKSVYNVSKYEPYYNVYDDDQDVYRDIDYGNYQNERKTPNRFQQALQKPQHRLQPQQQTQILNNAPAYTNQDYRLQSELVDSQQPEKLISSRGRNRGSVTYTTGGNEYDPVTSSVGGRTRPTLKPSTSIVSKSSETVDIYKHSPKRPDPVYPTPQVDKAAAKCRKDICLLPDCSCGGKDIPGDLSAEETPQIVLLTFDDSVNELNKGLYSDLFEKGRVNPNGCPISATFYVSHEWTDYSMVQNLYAAGHEIASHSVSHSFGEQFSQRKWTKEIVGQREILAAYGGVRQDDIRGMRAPFLAVGGNKMFKMLYDANFTYDSSMPIYENRPPSWPYTLDYKLFHDCMIPPCPTRSYPGVWEVPMVMWQDLNGGRCSMGDACSNPPNSDGVYKMLIKNFERHFTTNRAPFGLFYHSSWFTQPHHKEGFIAFLDTIVNMPEVWIITNWQAIQWARDPTPISRLNQFTPFNCDYPERPRRCNNPKVCNLWHKSGVRYLKTCQPCPDVYPWTGKTGVRNSRVDNDDTLTE